MGRHVNRTGIEADYDYHTGVNYRSYWVRACRGGESANEFPDFPRSGIHPKTSNCCTTVGVCKNTVASPRIAYGKHRCWPRPSPRPFACFKMRAEWRSQLLENYLSQNAPPTPRPDKSFDRDQDTAQTGDARTIQRQCISAGLGRRNVPNKK